MEQQDSIGIYDQDRGEDYSRPSLDGVIQLPLTKLGFDNLLARLCSEIKIPVDVAAKTVIAGYVHHIPNEQNTSSIDTLVKVLWKSISNSTTWRIDQEIKEANRLAMAAAQAEQKARDEALAIEEAKKKREAKEASKSKMRVVPKGTTHKHAEPKA